jgi:CRISPR type III-B/RAMP module RAMP protein Cmr6
MSPSKYPLPAPIARFLSLPGPANRSLLFDRGMDRYEADFKIPAGGKEGFLRSFADAFRPQAGYSEVLARREKALTARGARSILRITRTRLVVGLGLPHPTETGFLFDRITGCPYLPGSSVKGLLRAAARLVSAGELEGDRLAWTDEEIRRIFGPELGGEWTPQTGSVVFYDAFPTKWPSLEVDILTPHHRDHNDRKAAPADWDEPNPVSFLVIAPATAFRFTFGPGDRERFKEDFPKIERLLCAALDWLAIGAKKAAGYGVFGDKAPAAPDSTVRGQRKESKKTEENRPQETASTVKEIPWKDAEIGWHQGSPVASRGSQRASGSRDALPAEALEALKKHKKLRADVVVVKTSGSGFRLQKILEWKPGRPTRG